VTTTYTWDAESRLKGSQSAGTNTVYDYDFGGIRVSQSVNGTETKYLVDKNRNYAQVLEEYNGSGTQAAYIYGNDLISQSRNGVDSFYGYDGLGSTRVLTDELGAVTDKYTYDAYGRISKSTGTTDNSYLYAGEQFDKGLNQYYLRDRYYNQNLGSFSSRDNFEGEILSPLSLSKYHYVQSNPVNFTDPSGQFSWMQLLVTIQIASTISSSITYANEPTGLNAGLLIFDILTFPAGFAKGAVKLFASRAAASEFAQATANKVVNSIAEPSALAAKNWLDLQGIYKTFLGDITLQLLYKKMNLTGLKSVDWVAQNLQKGGKYVLVEAKSKLSSTELTRSLSGSAKKERIEENNWHSS
jgi:RHS repeat-associated protein